MSYDSDGMGGDFAAVQASLAALAMKVSKRSYKVWVLSRQAAETGGKAGKLKTGTWLNKYARVHMYVDLPVPWDEREVGRLLRAKGVRDGETAVMEKALMALPGKIMRPQILTMWEGEKTGELGKERERMVDAARDGAVSECNGAAARTAEGQAN